LHKGILYGGAKDGTNKTVLDLFAGNTLNVRAINNVKGIANFEYINFYLPSNLGKDGTLLTVSGDTFTLGATSGNCKDGCGSKPTKIDISGLSGATSLKVGDEIALLSRSTGIITASTWESPRITTVQAGLTLDYTFNIPKGKEGDTKITARVTQIKVRPEVKALAEGYFSGMAFSDRAVTFF
jgi:hypothetical protein